MIDKYNRAFGPVILVCVATGIMYFSVNIFQVFKDGNDLIGKATALMSFSWFGIMLVASAQVNEEVRSCISRRQFRLEKSANSFGKSKNVVAFQAGNIVEILKGRFQNEKMWSKHHGKCIETAQGLMLVLYETQTASVGLKGLGFFTCTYGFIGTVTINLFAEIRTSLACQFMCDTPVFVVAGKRINFGNF